MLRPLLLLLILGGCIEPSLVECADGRTCPDRTVCDLAHASCVTEDQLAACAGQADQAPCTAGAISGFCSDQVCLSPGCGNHAVEPGEACDDGNVVSGDGCSADCMSSEVCGNGVVDPGEACDDGNLRSKDGCDSRCKVETYLFSTDGIEPTHGNPNWGTYDPIHHEYVHFDDGLLWAWQLDHWELRSTTGPSDLTWYQVVFDPDRKVVVVVGLTGASGQQLAMQPVRVFEFDGSVWAERATINPPGYTSARPGTAAYNPTRHVLFVFGLANTQLAAELSASGTWTALPPTPSVNALVAGCSAVYDRARHVTVVAIGSSTPFPEELEWGTSWTLVTTKAMPGNATQGFGLTFDLASQRVLAVGGLPLSSAVSTWNGTDWSLVTSLPLARSNPEAVFDPDRSRLVVFGGGDGTPVDHDTVFEFDSLVWSTPMLAFPTNEATHYAYAFDDARDRLVAVRSGLGGLQTWSWSAGVWTRLDSGTLPNPPAFSIAFDPIRGGVMFASGAVTHLLGDTGWTPVAGAGAGAGPLALATTFALDKTLVAVGPGTRTFGEGATMWIPVSVLLPVVTTPTIAYDARNAVSVMIDRDTGNTFELDTANMRWSPTVSPGPQGYSVVEDRRRGTIWFEAPDAAEWERVDGDWVQRPRPGLPVDGPAVYSSRHGEVITIGLIGTSRVIYHRAFVSTTPAETCATQDDADGDGLAGCADPDCWWQCSPSCPPYSTAPGC